MFGRKKKKPDVHYSKSKQRLEVLNKNIDLNKLVKAIENFLEKSDDPFYHVEYSIHDIPEGKGKYFLIEHGMKDPTIKFLIVIEGDENNLKIYDHIPKNHTWFSSMVLPGAGQGDKIIKHLNARTFKIKLWDYVLKVVKALEN